MAYKAFRRSFATGIALVGAGTITFSSIAVPPDNDAFAVPEAIVANVHPGIYPRTLAIDVQNVALVSYLEILGTGAADALTESADTWHDDIPALFSQLVEQWPDPHLLPLNHSLLAAALMAPVAPLAVGPFTDAAAEVLAQALPAHGDDIREALPAAVDYTFARLVGPLVSAIGATGAAHQDYYWAGMAGDPVGQNVALLHAPIKVVDGLLFGGYGDVGVLLTGEVGGERVPAPGLLTPWGQYPEDRSVTEEESVDDLSTDATLSVVEPASAATVQTPQTEEAVESQELSGQTRTEIETTTEDAVEAVASPPPTQSVVTTTADVTEDTATASADADDPDPGATAVTGADHVGVAEHSEATERTRTTRPAGKEVGKYDKPATDATRAPTASKERKPIRDDDTASAADTGRKPAADKDRKPDNDK